VPGLDSRFDGYDWLIGNHSDELTPWIPVMATLTSDHTKFFVLPCCPFGFTGKYQRRSGKPRYRDYLDFVKEVCLTHVLCSITMQFEAGRIFPRLARAVGL
jgi:tRNASer (uridine44-2'-O)-methyltransferase